VKFALTRERNFATWGKVNEKFLAKTARNFDFIKFSFAILGQNHSV